MKKAGSWRRGRPRQQLSQAFAHTGRQGPGEARLQPEGMCINLVLSSGRTGAGAQSSSGGQEGSGPSAWSALSLCLPLPVPSTGLQPGPSFVTQPSHHHLMGMFQEGLMSSSPHLPPLHQSLTCLCHSSALTKHLSHPVMSGSPLPGLCLMRLQVQLLLSLSDTLQACLLLVFPLPP